MKQYYVYLHCKPDGTPFYVGKGLDHRAYAFSNRNAHHKRVVKKYGRENIGIYIFHCASEELALLDEVRHIAQLLREGYVLTNKTLGGEGSPGCVCSEEKKIKLRNANLGKPCPEHVKRRLREVFTGRPNPRKGTKLSKEACLKLSIAHQGVTVHTESSRAKIGAAHRGKIVSEETRRKSGDAHRNPSKETRLKISNSLLGSQQTASNKEALRIANTGRVPTEQQKIRNNVTRATTYAIVSGAEFSCIPYMRTAKFIRKIERLSQPDRETDELAQLLAFFDQ